MSELTSCYLFPTEEEASQADKSPSLGASSAGAEWLAGGHAGSLIAITYTLPAEPADIFFAARREDAREAASNVPLLNISAGGAAFLAFNQDHDILQVLNMPN